MPLTSFPFRPRKENLPQWELLRKQCEEKGISMSSLFNAMLFPLNAELARQDKDSRNYYTLNLGTLEIE